MMTAGSGATGKHAGAMLAIGEVASRVGVPTHILRYWETRFPQLRPLQRSGRRRYYRAEDVALVERIHHLLHKEGFTVEGARKALEAGSAANFATTSTAPKSSSDIAVDALQMLRARLVSALEG